MILHSDYTAETDMLRVIRDQLETQETVETLHNGTGQVIDAYDGVAQVARQPATNYIVGHGIAGLAIDWVLPDGFAKQLIERRGLQTGDILCVITCFAGENHGAAWQLAQAIGARGIVGVTVTAPEDYIHWNAHGELLLKSYRFDDPTLKAAAKAWSRAEDKAWNQYVKTLKAWIAIALKDVPPPAADAAAKYVLNFAARRPADNMQNAIAALIAKAQNTSPADRPTVLKSIITQSMPVPRMMMGTTSEFREGTHEDWSEELRTLLTELHELAGPGGGQARAAGQVSAARAQLRQTLAAAWPAYSAGYYDTLRVLSKGTAAASQWRTFASALPVPVAATDAPVQPGTEQVVDASTTEVPFDIDAEIQRLLTELGNL